MTLLWHGDEIALRLERAAAEATEATVDAAIEETQAGTPVETGRARDSVRREGSGLAITWGYHVGYGLFIEVGEQGRAGHHAMRKAADHQYAQLPERIAEAYR